MNPSRWNALFRASWSYLPNFLLDLVDYIPTREYKRFRHTTKVINKVSKRLIEEKTEALLSGGKTSKDVMSILGTSLPLLSPTAPSVRFSRPRRHVLCSQCAQTYLRTRRRD